MSVFKHNNMWVSDRILRKSGIAAIYGYNYELSREIMHRKLLRYERQNRHIKYSDYDKLKKCKLVR